MNIARSIKAGIPTLLRHLTKDQDVKIFKHHLPLSSGQHYADEDPRLVTHYPHTMTFPRKIFAQ